MGRRTQPCSSSSTRDLRGFLRKKLELAKRKNVFLLHGRQTGLNPKALCQQQERMQQQQHHHHQQHQQRACHRASSFSFIVDILSKREGESNFVRGATANLIYQAQLQVQLQVQLLLLLVLVLVLVPQLPPCQPHNSRMNGNDFIEARAAQRQQLQQQHQLQQQQLQQQQLQQEQQDAVRLDCSCSSAAVLGGPLWPLAAATTAAAALGDPERVSSQGWDAVQEAIMLRHVQLCVDEGKLRLARDGLHQYRIVSQHANTQSLGKVVAELRSRAEAKLAAAKARAGEDVRQQVVSAPEDLDVDAETPENLLLSTLQVEIRSPEARDVHQALRAEWDVYKMILDLLRTTPKLERVYHDTARRAFQFCKENKRQQEFKRLCDVLRSHFLLILKNRNKEEFEVLLRPELHLETRMQQLAVAADLELWRECSNTAEDVHALGLLDLFHRSLRSSTDLFYKARERLLRWVALYFEKLSRVLWVGENYLFHALAFIKFILHVRGFKKSAAPNDIQVLANIAVLAVLAIPTDSTEKRRGEGLTLSQPDYEQKKRMAMLLGHSAVPTRESLLTVIKTKDVLSAADQTCQDLFSLLEAEFTPLKLCALAQPLLETLAGKASLQPYLMPLKRVMLQKLAEQLAKVYVSLSIDYFTSHICSSEFLSWAEAEKLLVSLVHSSRRATDSSSSSSAAAAATAATSDPTISVRIDYASKAIIFERNESCPEREIQRNFVSLSKALDIAVHAICPGETFEQQQQRAAYQEAMRPRIQAEAAHMNERLKRTNLRRLEKQEEQQKLEEERRRREVEQRIVEEKQERERREEASKRRVERRQQEERIKARSETAALMLSEIRRIGSKDNKILIKGKQLTDINIQDVLDGNVDYDDLEKAQRLQLDKERLLRVRQRRLNFKKVCHFVRACREEELPLLDAWAQKQLDQDTQILQYLQNKHEEEHRAAFAAALEEKTAFECFKDDKEVWVTAQLQQRQQQFAAAAAQQRQRLILMLQQQKIHRARERREEALRKQRQLEEQRRVEEEEKRYLEELEKQRAEEETKQKRLAELAEKQRQREREIEAKHGLARKEGTVRRGDGQVMFTRKGDTNTAAQQQSPPSPLREQQQQPQSPQRDTPPRFRDPQQQQQHQEEEQQQQPLEWRRSTPLQLAERETPPRFRDEPLTRRSEKPSQQQQQQQQQPAAAAAAAGEVLNWRTLNRERQKQQEQHELPLRDHHLPVRQPQPQPQQQQQQEFLVRQLPQQQQDQELSQCEAAPPNEEDGFTRVRRRK
ncbi:hypothetical protein Esti_006167 [Eimeria stiedai]